MQLDRLATLAALEFVEPAIDIDSEGTFNYVNVRFDKSMCYFETSNGTLTKRASVPRPITTEESAKKELESGSFVIPYSTVWAFKQLVKKHKKKAKKLAKNDDGFLLIDISECLLQSFNEKSEYKKPAVEPKNYENEFNVKKSFCEGFINMNSKDIEAALKGFMGSKPVQISTTGDGEPLHFYQKSTGFEAVLQQCEPEEEE